LDARVEELDERVGEVDERVEEVDERVEEWQACRLIEDGQQAGQALLVHHWLNAVGRIVLVKF
jgi:hypothetical protein